MKIAIYGGSFNPLHLAHDAVASTLVTKHFFNLVLFIPSFIPPHKMIQHEIPAFHRLTMCRLYCEAKNCEWKKRGLNSSFVTEGCEIERGGLSYTYDTLIYLTNKYKNTKFSLVLGEDSAAEFTKWYRAADIASMVSFIVAPRNSNKDSLLSSERFNSSCECVNLPKGSYCTPLQTPFNNKTFPYKYSKLKDTPPNISSTEIRRMIKDKKDCRSLLPAVIYDYIREHGLYT